MTYKHKQEIIDTILHEFNTKPYLVMGDDFMNNLYKLSSNTNKLLRLIWDKRAKRNHTVERMFIPGTYLEYKYNDKSNFHRDKSKLIALNFIREFDIDSAKWFVILPWSMHYIPVKNLNELKQECKYHLPSNYKAYGMIPPPPVG